MSELRDLITYLQDNSIEKANKVKRIHDDCINYSWLKEVFKMTYDPSYQYYVKKKFPNLINNSKNLFDFNESYWKNTVKPLLIKLSNRELNTEEIINNINNILNQLNIIDQEILRNVIFKDLRIGFAARSINDSINEELIPVADTQLCKTFDTSMKIKNVKGFWASRKLNGLRGRFKLRNGTYMFLTREDLPLIGFDDIVKELKIIQQIYDLSLIDGEIFNINLPFQSIISVARGEKSFDPEQKRLLIFNVFNVQRNNYKWKDTKEMINYINLIFHNENAYTYIKPLKYEWVDNDNSKIVKLCRQYTDEGYEGIVLRDPTVTWEAGKRNNHLLKYKLFFECDLTVKDILYGVKGKKWENSITAFLCEGTVRAKKIKVGTNILYRPIASDEMVDKNEEYIDLPVKVEATCSVSDKERALITKDGKDNIGRLIEVSFQTFTDKPDENGVYSLQFPVFEKFKDIR